MDWTRLTYFKHYNDGEEVKGKGRVKKIVMIKFIHMILILFYRYDLHNFLNKSWRLLNDFADLVSVSPNSIEFHIFGDKVEGKDSSV